MPVLPLHSLTSQSLDAKFAPKQRRYKSSFSASYLHHPSPPPRLAAPAPAPNPTFEALRAAAARLNLPGEDEQHGPPVASATPAPRRPVRKVLLGAMALAVCALAAGSYYAWTARAPDGGPAASRITLEALAQRFHDLTANQAMVRAIGEKIALLQPALLSWPMTNPAAPAVAVAGQPARDDGPGRVAPSPSASRPVPPNPSDASSPTGASPSGLPMSAETAAPPPEAAGQAKLAPAQAEPTAPSSAAAGTAPDGTGAAAASVPPVITAQQLVDTLALLRQMGLLVRDVQAENEGLRTQVAGLAGIMQGKVTGLEQRLVATAHDMHDAQDENAKLRTQVAALADTLQASSRTLEQRLSLALARNPAAASEPGKPDAEAPPSSAPPPAADAMAPGLARTVRDYHVQAASLGIAVLGDADPVPGQAGRHLVAVGDQVPGVGRVISITQRGTSWVVQTDHGAIQ